MSERERRNDFSLLALPPYRGEVGVFQGDGDAFGPPQLGCGWGGECVRREGESALARRWLRRAFALLLLSPTPRHAQLLTQRRFARRFDGRPPRRRGDQLGQGALDEGGKGAGLGHFFFFLLFVAAVLCLGARLANGRAGQQAPVVLTCVRVCVCVCVYGNAPPKQRARACFYCEGSTLNLLPFIHSPRPPPPLRRRFLSWL